MDKANKKYERKQYLFLTLTAEEALAHNRDLLERLRFSPEKLKKAYVSSLNKSLAQVSKTVCEIATSKYWLSKAYFRKHEKRYRASFQKPYITLKFLGKKTQPLVDYNISSRGGKNIKAAVLRPNAPKPLVVNRTVDGKQRVYKAFFIAGKNSGKKLVAERDPDSTYLGKPVTLKSGKTKRYVKEGLKVLHGPSYIGYLLSQETQTAMQEASNKVVMEKLEHQVRYYIGDIVDTRKTK